MKYYLYISDAKVDMLYSQMEEKRDKEIKSTVGIDWKIFRFGKETKVNVQADRITRLEAVVAYLRTYGRVGTINTSDDFIDETASLMPSLDPTLAYFTGQSGGTVIGLAGSAVHIIGNAEGVKELPRMSALNFLMRWLFANAPQESPKRGIQSMLVLMNDLENGCGGSACGVLREVSGI